LTGVRAGWWEAPDAFSDPKTGLRAPQSIGRPPRNFFFGPKKYVFRTRQKSYKKYGLFLSCFWAETRLCSESGPAAKMPVSDSKNREKITGQLIFANEMILFSVPRALESD
jgi:hypothetical protein